MSEFEEAFPISAHWIEWSPSKNRYDCHVGLADSKCSEYNNMFKVWQHQQAKIDESYEIGVALNTETINQRRYILSQSNKINELQKRIDVVLKKLEGDLAYVEQDQRKNFEFLQMAMIRCLKDDIKALRGDS